LLTYSIYSSFFVDPHVLYKYIRWNLHIKNLSVKVIQSFGQIDEYSRQ